MNTPLDNAITAAASAEATYAADVENVATIQTAIDTATLPLGPARSKLADDTDSFNKSLDALSAAALAAKIPTLQFGPSA